MSNSIPNSQDYEEGEPYYIDRIHPINARFLRDTMPHRFYTGHCGSIMELVAIPISELLGEKHSVNGGIIGINYVSVDSRFLDTLIFDRKGELFHVNDHGYLERAFMDVDRLHFLLNPVEFNGWQIIQDTGEHEMQRGMRPKSNHPQMSNAMAIAIRKTLDDWQRLMPTR